MDNGLDHLSEFTLHVVLATFPQTQEKDFHNSVQQGFYKKYRETSAHYLTESEKNDWYLDGDTETPVLYNPLSYFIVGNYDIAYITLIDNFKFAQRLFEPQVSHADGKRIKLFAPHTFQSFTGIAHHSSKELKQFFHSHVKEEAPTRKYFLGICNLKLNNGFLIGNGVNYLEAVLAEIDKIIGAKQALEYVKLQSFSWFEISLLIFGDDPQQIADIIQVLRRLTIQHMLPNHPEILPKSLYQELYPKEDIKFFEQANVFADTHTYIGIHSDVFLKDPKYKEQLLKSAISLKAEVEWQVKPGHMHQLSELLHRKGILSKQAIEKNEKFFLAGRSDYAFKSELTSIKDVVGLISCIIDCDHTLDEKNNLYAHVRKIKTNIYFNPVKKIDHPDKNVIGLHKELMGLAEDINVVAHVNEQLKSLKLSRQIRSKVLKIFSNYNNGVQDIVLFPYLLDFKIFIERLKVAINKADEELKTRFKKPSEYTIAPDVDKLEDVLMKMIDIFQEGFNIRMLNPYQFEDINDFDLDFNSSIQQLLSAYSSIAFEIGNLIYWPDYTYGPVIQLNLKDTVSNDSSINYYVHHLTSPEFIFATLTKEITNAVPGDEKNLKNLFKLYQARKHTLLKRNPLIRDMDERKLINPSYFMNDAFRYVWSYHMDFDIFYYWFWTYNFQNASLFSEMGLLDEKHFEKELFRVLFVAKFFEDDCTGKVFCPLPELETYWDRHFENIAKAVDEFIAFLDEEAVDITRPLIDYLEKQMQNLMQRGEREVTISHQDNVKGVWLRRNIEGGISRQDLNPLGNDFTSALKRRAYIFNHKDALPPELEDKKDSILYLEWYMWYYLNKIRNLNNCTISFVRRNWKNGKPLRSFAKNSDPACLYSVDQTGGLFFESNDNQKLYLIYSSRTILDLWHYSLLRKKKFITAKLAAAL